jgi:hypothetical protein
MALVGSILVDREIMPHRKRVSRATTARSRDDLYGAHHALRSRTAR